MTEQSFNSIFDSSIQIDIANLLVEILFKNKLESWKKPLPKCAFWRKEYSAEYKHFAKLASTYSLELSAIRDLLKVFAPIVLSKYIADNKITTIRFLTKEQKSIILYDLFNKQVKLIKELDIPVREIEAKDNKKIATSLNTNKTMKL